ncbi:hypothetical protein Btru_064091 [Bulinus truncatus]|nr:hypothetical protein Btru_064091 [Bulinus truncatus]
MTALMMLFWVVTMSLKCAAAASGDTLVHSGAPSSASPGHSLFYHGVRNDTGHGDMFQCGLCVCSHTFHQYIIANCSSRQLVDVPGNLPSTLWSLNMSGNVVYHFNSSSILDYKNLDSLIVSNNTNLRHVSNTSREVATTKLTSLDLSHNYIRSIDDGSFRHHGNLQQLLLGGNSLTNIMASMFDGLGSLTLLNLTRNLISFIANDTFDKLRSLRVLDLSLNPHLTYTLRLFPPRLFDNLTRLQKLYIQGNTQSDTWYPNMALQKLTRLQLLSSDAMLNNTFGHQLLTLENFESLYLGVQYGHCRLRNLTEDFFQNIPHLRTFVIYGCNLFYIDPAAYARAPLLHTLEISHTSATYDLFKALDHLSGLQNSSLKVLRLIYLYRTQSTCRVLKADHAKYLQHIQLEELDLSWNRIASIHLDFIRLLPKTLNRLVLSYNKLSSAIFSAHDLISLTELVEVDVNNQKDSDEDYPKYDIDSLAEENHSYVLRDDKVAIDSCSCQNYTQKRPDYRLLHSLPLKNSQLPPNLRIIKGSDFTSFGNRILRHMLYNTSLSEVDFSDNFLSDWGHMFLPYQLRKADLSNNYCKAINVDFFINQSQLVYFNARNNILGESFANDKFGQIFRSLDRLAYLDISMNLIYKLPSRFLKGLKNLETLIASDNKLQLLNLTIGHMTRLNKLDFSRNSITWISTRTREDLDLLAASKKFDLDLTFNPLPCTCSGFEVMSWLANTKVKLINQVNLMCRGDNGVSSSIGNLTESVELLRRSCISKSWIFIASILSTVFLVTLFCLILMYRFRWKLRYLRNTLIAKCIGFEPKGVDLDRFKFDAFLIYDNELLCFVTRDCVHELEVKRGLKLCVIDRDFMPGTYVVSDILSAVQNSNKTIPIVTPQFYDDDYTEYAVKMALMEEIHASRQVLHLLVYQSMDQEEMSEDFVYIMKGNHYTEYPPQGEVTPEFLDDFWDELCAAIKQT